MAKISFINCIFIFLISQKVCGKAASYDKTNKRSGNNDGNDLIFATAVSDFKCGFIRSYKIIINIII